MHDRRDFRCGPNRGRPFTQDQEKDEIRRLVHATLKTRMDRLDADVFTVPEGTVFETIAALQKHPKVACAEPNDIGRVDD